MQLSQVVFLAALAALYLPLVVSDRLTATFEIGKKEQNRTLLDYIYIYTSGDTLLRDNCQLIGMSLIVLTR